MMEIFGVCEKTDKFAKNSNKSNFIFIKYSFKLKAPQENEN